MITNSEAVFELNARGYYLQSTTPPVITPPVTIPVTIPDGENIVDKYGTMIVIGLALMFMIAIYPEGGGQ